MTPRTLLIVGAVVVGIALLGPYIGVHTLTSPPTEEMMPAPSGRRDERSIQPSNRRPRTVRETAPVDQRREAPPARDLSAIEDLLTPESER